jgi:hypothetical protein
MLSKRRMILIRATDEEHALIQSLAKREKRTVSNLLLWLAAEYQRGKYGQIAKK